MAPCIRPKGYIDCYGVAERLGIAKSSLKLIIKAYDDFPKRRRFGAQMFMWREDEINRWVDKRVREAEAEAMGTEAGIEAETESDPFLAFVRDFGAMMKNLRAERAARFATA